MSLLQALGIDISVVAQLGIAAVSFLILATAVFNSFQRAYLQRLTNTIGNQSSAEETFQKIEVVKQSYETRVKQLNAEIQAIFEAEKQKAKDTLVEKQRLAKEEIEKLKEETSKQFEVQFIAFQAKKNDLVDELSNTIYDLLVSQR
jgi:F0F1-type ATP synthase membrane subunit b/b'